MPLSGRRDRQTRGERARADLERSKSFLQALHHSEPRQKGKEKTRLAAAAHASTRVAFIQSGHSIERNFGAGIQACNITTSLLPFSQRTRRVQESYNSRLHA